MERKTLSYISQGLPRWLSNKESTSQLQKCGCKEWDTTEWLKQTKISLLSNEIYIDIKWELHHNKDVLCLVTVLSNSCNLMDCSPSGFSVRGGSSGKNTGTGWKCPPPGDLPNLGIKLNSPAFQAYSLPAELLGEPHNKDRWHFRQVNKKLEGKPIGEYEWNNTNSSFVDANYFMEWYFLWSSFHNSSLKCDERVSLEKEIATHSSTLAWKIPQMEEPGRLQSMGSRRLRHDWATSLSLFTFMNWRRKWQPTPVFLPGESQGWGSLVGCHLWGRTESDTTKVI